MLLTFLRQFYGLFIYDADSVLDVILILEVEILQSVPRPNTTEVNSILIPLAILVYCYVLPRIKFFTLFIFPNTP